MFRKAVVALSAILLCHGAIKAQQPCGTDEVHEALLKQHPELLFAEEQIANMMREANKTTLSPGDTTVFDVPLVIHVVHDYGSENLSDNDIYEAVKNYTEVFLARNADTSNVIAPFKKYIGNTRIRFHLATKDPSGKPTKGIVRHFSYLTTSGSDNAKFEPWPNNKYINIWFIRQFGAGATGAAAYAYYPSTAASIPYYDGIIGLYTYLDYEKSIPHELGHVLNLAHTWGSTNNPDVACGDDNVDDTPPTRGHNPVGCTASALYDVTCATGYFKRYTSLSGADSVVNYPDTTNSQNIMDYTYCSRMFSKGQSVRMRNALTSSVANRNNLYTTANLAATGATAPFPDLPPVADFSVERANGAGLVSDARTSFMAFTNASNFTFRNRSWNDTITGIQWIFSNGAATPTSTSTGGVNNKFSVPGWVSVTLIASSNAGNDTFVNTQAVYAADTTPVSAVGYRQSFSTVASVDNWPMVNFYKNQYKWMYYSGAGYGDNQCIKYRSFDTTNKRTGSAYGDFDDIYTPAFDLSGITGDFYFNFLSAGARIFGSGTMDSIQIEVSTNGGSFWNRIGGYSGTNLSNAGSKSGEFKPTTTAEWVPRAIRIPETYRTRNTYFRFRYRPGSRGNNLYIDDVNLNQFPVGVEQHIMSAATFTLYPNPAADGTNLLVKPLTDGTFTFTISDIAGKTISVRSFEAQSGVATEQHISRDEFPAAGIYFVTLKTDGSSRTEKLVAY